MEASNGKWRTDRSKEHELARLRRISADSIIPINPKSISTEKASPFMNGNAKVTMKITNKLAHADIPELQS